MAIAMIRNCSPVLAFWVKAVSGTSFRFWKSRFWEEIGGAAARGLGQGFRDHFGQSCVTGVVDVHHDADSR